MKKISYQLFFITQEKVKHIDLLPVEQNAIKQGLASFIAPGQKVQFHPHMLAALAMA